MKITKSRLRRIIKEVITDVDTGLSRGVESYAPPPAPTEEEVRSVLHAVSEVIMELINNEEEFEWTFHIDDYINLFQQRGQYRSIYSYALDWLDNEGIIKLEGSSGYYHVTDPEFLQVVNY